MYTKVLKIRNEEFVMGVYDIQTGSFGGSPFQYYKTPKI